MTEKAVTLEREAYDKEYFRDCIHFSREPFDDSLVDTIESVSLEPIPMFFAITKAEVIPQYEKLPLYAFLENRLRVFLREDPIGLTKYERKKVEAMVDVCSRKKEEYMKMDVRVNLCSYMVQQTKEQSK